MDEEEQKDVLEVFDKYVENMELPFNDITINGQVWKLMYKAFREGYKFGRDR